MTSFRPLFRQLLKPGYDELTLFALSFTCLLFLVSSIRSTFGDGSFVPAGNGLGAVVLASLLAAGICLSLYHAFSKRKKGRHEKQLMFLFAALINGFSGVWGATYLFSMSEGWSWFLIFPIMNLATTYVIFSQTKERVLEDDCIDDGDVTPTEVALSAAIIVVAFLVTHFYRHMHWAAAFSVCVAYGTNVNRWIVNLLVSRRVTS